MHVRKLLMSAAIVAGLIAPAAAAIADPPKHKCAPGQHPAPVPGFKPGVCDK